MVNRPGYAFTLILLLLVLSVAALWQTLDHHVHDVRRTDHPAYVAGLFFEELAAAATHTHFEGMTQLLNHVAQQEASVELTAEQTLALLDRMARPLVAHEAPSASVARASLLVEKSLPDPRGVWLGSLLPGYVCYVRQRDALHQQMEQQLEHHQLAQQHQQHTREVAIRETCLGPEVSRALFAEQDRLTAHLLQRGAALLQPAAATGDHREP